MVCANALACVSSENPMEPEEPPREIVTILPFDWQAWIPAAKKEQFSKAVPGKSD